MNPKWQRVLDEVTVRLEFMYERMQEEWTDGEPEKRGQVGVGALPERGSGSLDGTAETGDSGNPVIPGQG